MIEKLDIGYIRKISVQPFNLYLFTDEQIEIFKTYSLNGDDIIHIDATGSILTNVDGKCVFYYALVIPPATSGYPPLPVGELILNSHTNVDVSHFLDSILYALRQKTPKPVKPNIIVTDLAGHY